MKKVILTILVLCAVLLVGYSAGAETSGTCGDNLTWVLDDEGTLTISGEGAMEKYYDYGTKPQWWSYRDRIITVRILPGVTDIGRIAFDGCDNLTSVTIPESVLSLGDKAFSNCGSLTSIIISKGVTSIASGTFQFCDSLTSVAIPESVTSIGDYAFYHCASLKSVTIPESVTSIGRWAFQYCASLKSVTIPESVISIGYNAFDTGSTLTCRVYEESYAHTWCKNNSLPYVLIGDEPPVLPGDPTGDGEVDIFDALAILQFAVGWETEVNQEAGDVNDDGVCDIFDALAILQYSVGWNVELK